MRGALFRKISESPSAGKEPWREKCNLCSPIATAFKEHLMEIFMFKYLNLIKTLFNKSWPGQVRFALGFIFFWLPCLPSPEKEEPRTVRAKNRLVGLFFKLLAGAGYHCHGRNLLLCWLFNPYDGKMKGNAVSEFQRGSHAVS